MLPLGLRRTIHAFLTLFASEAGKVVVELCDTDLVPVVQDVIDLHATHVAAGVSLEAEVPAGPLLISTHGYGKILAEPTLVTILSLIHI